VCGEANAVAADVVKDLYGPFGPCVVLVHGTLMRSVNDIEDSTSDTVRVRWKRRSN